MSFAGEVVVIAGAVRRKSPDYPAIRAARLSPIEALHHE